MQIFLLKCKKGWAGDIETKIVAIHVLFFTQVKLYNFNRLSNNLL